MLEVQNLVTNFLQFSLVHLNDLLTEVSVPSGPAVIQSQRTEVYINYKTDWPISSGFLLVLITYISPLFLFM